MAETQAASAEPPAVPTHSLNPLSHKEFLRTLAASRIHPYLQIEPTLMGVRKGDDLGQRAEEMGDLAVRRLKEPGLHFVGGVAGLALQVLPSGGRTWILRVMVGGRRRDMGLGGYPSVTVAGAREAAREARKLIREGIDPIEKAKAAKSALRAGAATVVTFKEAAKSHIAAHEAGWKNPKHRAQWRSTLEQYVYPVIGDLSVQDVRVPHILSILEPIWKTKTETATRVCGRIENVLDSAKARGQIPSPWENPARWRGHLDKLLSAPSKISHTVHHAALPIEAIGAFMKRLRAANGQGARALEFAILTAARSGEVRGATWAEIDLEKRVWTVPGNRMKAGREHRVPLSDAAVSILTSLPRMGGTDLVFPAARGGPLSDATLSAVLRRMEVAAVPHGFRSTFRDWCSERTNYPSYVAEMALAHTIGDKVEAAYRRGDLFEKRRRMMADWAAFLSRVEAKGKVVEFRGRA